MFISFTIRRDREEKAISPVPVPEDWQEDVRGTAEKIVEEKLRTNSLLLRLILHPPAIKAVEEALTHKHPPAGATRSVDEISVSAYIAETEEDARERAESALI